MVKDPRFVPGAGATEIELAKQLQAFADATPGLVQYGIKKYGESFEVVPRTIAETSGQKAIDMIASLYAAHAKGQTADGINVEVTYYSCLLLILSIGGHHSECTVARCL